MMCLLHVFICYFLLLLSLTSVGWLSMFVVVVVHDGGDDDGGDDDDAHDDDDDNVVVVAAAAVVVVVVVFAGCFAKGTAAFFVCLRT